MILNLYKAYIVAFILTLFIFMVHVVPSNNSMLNFHNDKYQKTETLVSHGYLNSVVEYHKTEPSFARRPLVTLFTETASKLLNIKKSTVFIVFNFLLLFLVGLLIYSLSNRSLISMVFYFLSFSIFFVFSPPVYTYDDLLQYFFILLYFILLKKHFFIPATVFLFLSILARESTVIILPGITFAIYQLNLWKIKLKTHLIVSIVGVLSYFIFIYWLLAHTAAVDADQEQISDRLKYLFMNFDGILITMESLLSLFLVLVFPMLLVYKSTNLNKRYSPTITAFLITVVINTIIVLCCTKARESRLFALPLLLFFPISGEYIKQLFLKFYFFKIDTPIKKALAILFCSILGIGIYRMFIIQYVPLTLDNYFYFDYLIVIMVLCIYILFSKKNIYENKH